jgi:DNA-binding NtrC family response regulator
MTDDRVREDTLINQSLAPLAAAFVPKIVAISGPGQGRLLAMTRATATAGRHPTNDLVLDDPRVSGVHLELRRGDNRVHVRDAGSSNGTWLGPHQVTEIALSVGAELRVGDTVIRIDSDETATAAGMSKHESFGELVGRSTIMRELFATLERVAPKNLNLLFQGEPGTGKEEMARAIALRSARAKAPFRVIDIPSVPEAMLDTVLFGSEKPGTGEVSPGVLETSNGGTVFIDEVGQLPLQTQAKLLRLLERQELTRVGGHAPVKTDVRVLSSSTRDLRHAIDERRFREDLFIRLSQVRVVLPPLRDRTEDVPVLCQKLLEATGNGACTLDESALAELTAHRWPGNVRELRNVLERAAALQQGGTIRRADIAGQGAGFRGSPEEKSALDVSGTYRVAKERALERFESAYLSALMRRCGGNVSLASRESEIARHQLRDLLRKRALYGVAWDKEE